MKEKCITCGEYEYRFCDVYQKQCCVECGRYEE